MTKSPWSVKGVDPEAREAAKIAARRSGMTVGAWLTQTIRHAATAQLSGRGVPPPAAPPPSQNRYAGERRNAADRAPHSADDPAQRPAGDLPNDPLPGRAPPPAPTIEAVFESIQRLSARLAEAEERTAETIAPIASKVSELSEKLEEVRGQEGASTAPVERAVQKIVERIDRIEESSQGNRRPLPRAPENERRGLFGLFRKP